MKQRNPIAVFLLPFITFFIYGIVWSVKTKNEMNKMGASIPTAWLMIIPIVNLYWTWKYSEGVEKVTGGSVSAVLSFVLLAILGIIGMAILQNEFNKVSSNPVNTPGASGVPPAPAGNFAAPQPITQTQPDNSFGGPVTPSQTAAPANPVVAPSQNPQAIPSQPTVVTPNNGQQSQDNQNS